jgi:hypothetical protein
LLSNKPHKAPKVPCMLNLLLGMIYIHS